MTAPGALVTGSTSGIGLAIARALASQGMNLMLNGFGDPAAIEEQRRAIVDEFHVKALYSPADVTRPDEIVEMVNFAEAQIGPLEVLVNNAGIQFVAPIEKFPAEKWDQIIAVNLSASFHTMRCAIPFMKQRNSGRIINIASAHALVASPFKSAYVAAKHGVAGLTKTAALELAEYGITVNAICPGYVLTPLVRQQIPDTARARGISEEEVIRDVLLEAQPTKRFVTVEEVAALAVYLTTSMAASVTGALLSIDGGWAAH